MFDRVVTEEFRSIMNVLRQHGSLMVRGTDTLEYLYLEAEEKGAVLPGLPLDRDVIADAPNINMSLDDFDDMLERDAAEKYPAVKAGTDALDVYFNMTFSRPAIFYDPAAPAESNTLIMQPVRGFDFVLLYAADIKAVRTLIRHDAQENEEYLSTFRLQPNLELNGMTYAMALDKRDMIEKTLDAFERATGKNVPDKLRDHFRAIYLPEIESMDTLHQRSAIPDLVLAYIDSDDSVQAKKLPAGDDTKAIATRAHHEYCGGLRMYRN